MTIRSLRRRLEKLGGPRQCPTCRGGLAAVLTVELEGADESVRDQATEHRCPACGQLLTAVVLMPVPAPSMEAWCEQNRHLAGESGTPPAPPAH